ncbi:ribosome maturation factor RimM [Acetobacter oeni]|uniref:Ribosome maturation factor RimM n=1 Tax=Acetobacter oeni TaxID=304077 RepID=A0A511XMJ1_9PROT|nr:ribosomal RNA small subunit 16S rRNA processing protein RimM [Acetobacter oeni LMG 21952]GEN64167.1 ribosome maturation factor RimM [Acetobacter oeni]
MRGLVHVHSLAADPSSLASYGMLTDDHGAQWTLSWRGDGVAELRDARGGSLADRTAAQALVNRKLYVSRDKLPEPDADEFYHSDLIGLDARENGETLGHVAIVHDYGAGASLELDSGLVIPFTRTCVPEIDFAGRHLTISRPVEVIGEADQEPKRAKAHGGLT